VLRSLWLWLGPVVVTGALAESALAAGSAKWGYFKTPSGNIQCDYYVGDYVRCGIRSGLKPAPAKRGPHCFVPNRVELRLTGRAALAGPSSCPGEDEGDAGPFAGGQPGGPPVPVLAYGRTWRGGGVSCSGRGFRVPARPRYPQRDSNPRYRRERPAS
jgi:hypothetical protein